WGSKLKSIASRIASSNVLGGLILSRESKQVFIKGERVRSITSSAEMLSATFFFVGPSTGMAFGISPSTGQGAGAGLTTPSTVLKALWASSTVPLRVGAAPWALA